MHKFAEKASIATLASARQDKYKEITRALLRNYRKLNDTIVDQQAKELGFDMEKFNKDSADPSLKEIIRQDLKLGQSVRVRGVPAIFINGKTVKTRSLNALSRIVEQELKKKVQLERTSTN